MPDHRPGSAWTPDIQRATLALYTQEGLATASRLHGVPKPTIKRWVAAGLADKEPDRSAERVAPKKASEQSGPSTAAATAERVRQMARARERRTQLLAEASELALDQTIQRLQAVQRGEDSPLPVRELVGIWTRAEHDLASLTGEPTATTERPAVDVKEELMAKIMSMRANLRAVPERLEKDSDRHRYNP